MCYSAQIRAGYEKYVRAYGADISIREFVQLYWERSEGGKIKTPKAMDVAFATLGNLFSSQRSTAIASTSGISLRTLARTKGMWMACPMIVPSKVSPKI